MQIFNDSESTIILSWFLNAHAFCPFEYFVQFNLSSARAATNGARELALSGAATDQSPSVGKLRWLYLYTASISCSACSFNIDLTLAFEAVSIWVSFTS